MGKSGSIIAYNASFEKTILRHASETYTEYQDWVTTTEERIIDLLVPFRGFLYYHPAQAGSASLKDVLPALTGITYDDIGDITNGGMASAEYYRVTFDKGAEEKDRQRVYSALEKYCDLDTRAMIKILEVLEKESL